MAVTENAYTGNGSTTNYSFTFPYLKSTDIEVQVDATVQATSTWSLANATTVQFNTAPSNGAKIKILRKTNVDNLTATFYAGSAIKSEDLNDNFTQNLYSTQETSNRAFETTGGTITGDVALGEDVIVKFEGATDNAHETTVTVVDPTADRTITLPNVTGTVVTTGDTGTITATMLAANSVDSSELVDGSIDTSHIADSQVTTAKIAADAVNGTKIADNAIDSEHYVDGSIDTAHIADLNVTTAKIAADAVTGAKIADDAIDSEHYAADSIDAEHYAPGSVDATALASNAVTQAKVADDAIGADELAASAVVTASIVDNAVTLAKMADSSVGTSELVDSAVTAVKLATDAVTNAKVADSAIGTTELATNAVTTAKITDANVTTGKIADGAVTTAKIAASGVTTAKINADAIDSTKIADNAVTTDHIADAELTTLAGMQSGTASILAGGTALTATLAEINTVVDGKGVQTTISDSDAHYPTSGAVVDYVAAQIAPIGGLEVIATDAAFPNTQPASGVVISIADAGGLVVNGSGTSTTGRTAGGSTVTINNIASNFNSSTVDAGVCFQVSSTGSGQIYNYHKATLKEADLLNLSNDINDFGNRYRVNAGEPSSNNDDGDLCWDTNADKMKVYDGTASAWKEVTSSGDFKFLVPVDAGTTTAATFDGSDTSFDLKETTNSGSAASVTNINQLMVVLNGIVQKPNTGSYSASEEGFYLTDSDTIRFCTAPATGSTCFIVQSGSALTITTPGDNTVATAKIQNLAVTGAKIADDTITEGKLDVSNAPTNGQFLQAQSGEGGGLTWATVSTTDSSKMPLAGGTFTGDVTFDNQSNAGRDITWDESDDRLKFNDNTYIQMGTTEFLTIGHNGTYSFLTSNNDKLMLGPTGSAGTELLFGNTKKAETVTGGFTVTGTCTATSFAGDGSNLTGISTGVTSDGQNNTVAGTNAGDSFDGTNATDNTLYGYDAGTGITTGDDNTALGGKALQATTTGYGNTAIGYYALYSNTTAEHNVAVGKDALRTNTGAGNVALGTSALYSNTSAAENIAIGKNAMYANTTGHYNVAVGYNALDANTTGDKHTAIGKLALSANTTADENTAVGYYALAGNTTGQYNTGLGVEAGITNTTGSYNTSVGWKALNVGTGASCTAVGAEAGLSITAGNNCTYLGSSAGRYATGSQNVAIGSESMEGASGTNSGSESVIIGHQAGHTTTSGGKNTYVGYQAGYSNTSHSNVIAIGYKASENIVTGGSIAIGSEAGNDHTTCHTNICIGDNTDKDSGNNSGGHTATIIGHNSKRSGGTYNEGVYGNSATGLGSNKLYLGWSNVYHGGNSADFSTTSDQRIKKNIVNNNTGLSVINNIQVKNFEYKTKEEVKEAFPSFTNAQVESAVVEKSGTQLGLIAQELETVLPNCVAENDWGVKSVERDELFWYMLNAIKELSAKVTALEAK